MEFTYDQLTLEKDAFDALALRLESELNLSTKMWLKGWRDFEGSLELIEPEERKSMRFAHFAGHRRALNQITQSTQLARHLAKGM